MVQDPRDLNLVLEVDDKIDAAAKEERRQLHVEKLSDQNPGVLCWILSSDYVGEIWSKNDAFFQKQSGCTCTFNLFQAPNSPTSLSRLLAQ